jgi:hypothetical protein
VIATTAINKATNLRAGPRSFQTQLIHLADCSTNLVAIAMPNINFHRRLFWCISGGANLIDFDLNCKHLNLK